MIFITNIFRMIFFLAVVVASTAAKFTVVDDSLHLLTQSEDRKWAISTCLDQSSQSLAYDPSTMQIKYNPYLQNKGIEVGSFSNMTCPLILDLLVVTLSNGISEDIGSLTIEGKDEWQCIIPGEKQCDGLSSCLTDECGCGEDNSHNRFYCAQGHGCIVFAQLCDGVADCRDASDECLCQGFVEVICTSQSQTDTSVTFCLSPEDFCRKIRHSSGQYKHCRPRSPVECDQDAEQAVRLMPLHQCLRDNFHLPLSGWSISKLVEQEELLLTCTDYCGVNLETGWAKYCPYLDRSVNEYDFFCGMPWTKDVLLLNVSFKPEHCHISKLCDKVIDCSNGADEIGCPDGRFYCDYDNSHVSWVEDSQRCDNIKDCLSGRDECNSCDLGAFTSERYLLRSVVLIFVDAFLGVSICILNGMQIKKAFKQVPGNRVGKNDRILRIQICIFDILMGSYLLMILMTTGILALEGDYCKLDEDWRSSNFCTLFGVIFSFSSQGSLMVISLMSIIRSIQCRYSFIRISQQVVIWLSVGIWLLNLFTVLLPVLPTAYLQEIFRSELHLTNIYEHPFFSEAVDSTRLDKVYVTFYPNEIEGTTSVPNMLESLRNTTSDPGIFNYIEVGYYGSSPFCIHNLFKANPTYRTYKICYCAVVVGLLVVVSFSYAIILKKSWTRKAGNLAEQSNTKVAVKVSLIIASQLLCWIPFISVAVYFTVFPEQGIPSMLYEVFAVAIIPANSFLNPIFYSGAYKTAAEMASKGWAWLNEKKKDAVVEMEMVARPAVQHCGTEIEAGPELELDN